MVALTTEELLKNQLAEITEQQAAKTKPIELPKSIGIQYNAELQRMVKMIAKDIRENISPQLRNLAPEYTADGWFDVISDSLAALRARWSGERFTRFAERITGNFVQAVNLRNQQQMGEQFGRFGIDVFGNDPTLTEWLKATAGDNARLIKTIPEQYLNQVESIVIGNMRSGLRPSEIEKQLTEQLGVTQRRARVIARDQSSKVSNGLARKRMESAGVKHFRWVTSKDSRVRDEHTVLANRVTKYGKGIYSFEDLPLDKNGQPIAPGIPISCRCIQQPVLESEIERNKSRGLTNPNVKR